VSKDPREEFDDLFRVGDDEGDERRPRTYLAPALECRCGALIWLPYEGLPETDEGGVRILAGSDPPELPKAEWSQVFACTQCGSAAPFAGTQVIMQPVPGHSAGLRHSDAAVFLVESECGNKDCRTPFRWHVDMSGRRNKPSERNASGAVAAVRSGVFDGQLLPCGHRYRTIPAQLYRATPVTARMW
jgi:hypothetical protein